MDNQLRVYTKINLKPNFFQNLLRRYSVTNWLIGINVVVFILGLVFISFFGAEKVLTFLAIQPNSFFNGAIWTLITSMFMHGNFSHLFVNMISLFFVGSFVERLIGRKRFFWLYLISGLFAGLFFIFLAYYFGFGEWGIRIFGSPETFAVGASGAIFALGGLLAVLTPKLRVYVFFFIPMQMWVAMIFLLLFLWGVSLSAGLPIGNTAHFGGLIIGLGYGFYLRKKYPRKTSFLARKFS